MIEKDTYEAKGVYGAVAALSVTVFMGYLAGAALIRGTAWFPRKQEPKLFERGNSALEYWLLICFYLILFAAELWRFLRILQKEMKPNKPSQPMPLKRHG